MKYFKIVNPKGHNGIKYKNGINTDPQLFSPSGDCESGGIYFASTDIFAFLNYGTKVYEVTQIGEIYENPGTPKKYKAHSLDMTYIGETKSIEVIKYLIKNGAVINNKTNNLLKWSSENGYLDIIKLLVKIGVDIHIDNEYALRQSAENGHLNVVKYLIKKGADIHASDDYALRWSSEKGHIFVVKYLINKGADIHASDDYALKWSVENKHTFVVKFLISKGADFDKILNYNNYSREDSVNYLKRTILRG